MGTLCLTLNISVGLGKRFLSKKRTLSKERLKVSFIFSLGIIIKIITIPLYYSDKQFKFISGYNMISQTIGTICNLTNELNIYCNVKGK